MAGPAHPALAEGGGGCHLNRPIDGLLRLGGFEVLEMNRGYVAGPRVSGTGMARPATGGRIQDTNTWTEKGVAYGA